MLKVSDPEIKNSDFHSEMSQSVNKTNISPQISPHIHLTHKGRNTYKSFLDKSLNSNLKALKTLNWISKELKYPHLPKWR